MKLNFKKLLKKTNKNLLILRVITGVRFVLDNETDGSSTLYIQIQEGKLSADGIIFNNTVSWKPIAKKKNGISECFDFINESMYFTLNFCR